MVILSKRYQGNECCLLLAAFYVARGETRAAHVTCEAFPAASAGVHSCAPWVFKRTHLGDASRVTRVVVSAQENPLKTKTRPGLSRRILKVLKRGQREKTKSPVKTGQWSSPRCKRHFLDDPPGVHSQRGDSSVPATTERARARAKAEPVATPAPDPLGVLSAQPLRLQTPRLFLPPFGGCGQACWTSPLRPPARRPGSHLSYFQKKTNQNIWPYG